MRLGGCPGHVPAPGRGLYPRHVQPPPWCGGGKHRPGLRRRPFTSTLHHHPRRRSVVAATPPPDTTITHHHHHRPPGAARAAERAAKPRRGGERRFRGGTVRAGARPAQESSRTGRSFSTSSTRVLRVALPHPPPPRGPPPRALRAALLAVGQGRVHPSSRPACSGEGMGEGSERMQRQGGVWQVDWHLDKRG